MQAGLNYQEFQQAFCTELQEMLVKEGIPLSEKKGRRAYVDWMKAISEEGREKIKGAHLLGASGTEVVYRITAWTDAVLMELFDGALKITGLREDRVHCALLAIGGYGRGELNPYSDLDVMFLTSGEDDAESRELSENCLYLMWDLNLDVGHSMRSIPDCVTLAAADIRAKTSLIESRFLAGDRNIYERFVETARSRILRRDADAYLRTKIADIHEREKKYGRSLYLKEPQIKEGIGGLRDIHTAFWIAKVKYGVHSLRDLKERGVISEKEDRILLRAREFLWKVRNHLHFLSGRRNDILTIEMQDALAAFFKFKDFKHYLAVERFMRAYYLQTRNIRYFTTALISRCAPSPVWKRLRSVPFREKRVGQGLVVFGNRLCVPEDRKDYFREAPERLMEIFSLSQRYSVPLSDAAKERVLASLSLVDGAFRRSERVRDAFLRILGSENRVVKTLRQMHELRFLGRYLPEFGALTALVQHELYHAYTVDEHTLFALERLEGLRGSPYPQERFYSRLVQEIRRPAVLFLSLLLHDIGKAMGSGHADRGGEAIPAVLRRMGLGAEDVRTVELLVRKHLLLAHLSQRRDIHDPKLIAELARSVRDEDHLRMLTLVSYCDTNAVGPGIWNEWKDTLLQELFHRTREVIRTGLDRSVEMDLKARLEEIRKRIRREGAPLFGAEETARILEGLPSHYLLATPPSRILQHFSMIRRVDEEGLVIAWDHSVSQGYVELDLCTYDSDTPGLFSRIAGVLASRGINILGARIFTSRDGLVIDSVHVEPPDEKKREDLAFWNGVSQALCSALQRASHVEEILVVHEPPAYLKKKKGHRVPPRVLFDNAVSDHYTVIDVFAEDRIGLLYDITSCLAAKGVHIHSSKVATEADRAIDAFYVTDIFGHKITEPPKLEGIRQALLEALRGVRGRKPEDRRAR